MSTQYGAAGAGSADSFHSECIAYFDYLRRSGRDDHGFEDEYYFTIPAVSGQP